MRFISGAMALLIAAAVWPTPSFAAVLIDRVDRGFSFDAGHQAGHAGLPSAEAGAVATLIYGHSPQSWPDESVSAGDSEDGVPMTFFDFGTLSGGFPKIHGSRMGAFVGLGGPVSAAPEPGTWLMLFAGFGLVGLMMRRGRTALPSPARLQII